MKLSILLFATAAIALHAQAVSGFGTPPFPGVTLNADIPDAYQVNYFPNVITIGGGYINILNSGALGADDFGPGLLTNVGEICVNVYASSADEQLSSCCSCLVSPNGLASIQIADLVSNTLTGVIPGNGINISLLATIPGSGSGFTAPGTSTQGLYIGRQCNAAYTNYNSIAFGAPVQNLAPGLRAWGVKVHTVPVNNPSTTAFVETDFLPAALGKGQLIHLVGLCASIVANGSGAGTCKGCTLGALGAARQ